MTALVAGVADGAILLAIALGAAFALRRRSAALKHAVLALGIIAALVAPALEALLPQVPVIERPAQTTWLSSADTSSSLDTAGALAAAVEAPRFNVLHVVAALWIAGALIISAGLVIGIVRLRRIRRACTPADPRWSTMASALAHAHGIRRSVRVVQSADAAVLLTCGIFRPIIIVPSAAMSWPDDRVRHVLLHELAHIRRHDAAVQMTAEILRAAQWINPLVWVACRRLREESECACDDAVLTSGVDGATYASDLLAIARQLSAPRLTWTSAHAIAHPSTLERRVAAMLQTTRSRGKVGRAAGVAAMTAAIVTCVPLVAATLTPVESPIMVHVDAPEAIVPGAPRALQQPEPPRIVQVTPAGSASIAGRIVDDSGGVIPGARVTLADTQPKTQAQTTTNAEGRFVFSGVRASSYELSATLPGFTAVRRSVSVAGSAAVELTLLMPLGSVTESISVTCGEPRPASTVWLRFSPPRLPTFTMPNLVPVLYAQSPQAPVRVGGSVRAPLKTKDVKPVCPASVPEAPAVVRLNARIGADGQVHDVALVPGEAPAPPQALAGAAITAVRQWTFQPAHLNGVPVDVNMAVTVTFTAR